MQKINISRLFSRGAVCAVVTLVLAFLCLFFLAQPVFSADEEVKLKILAVNPSDTHKLKTTVQQVLPPEVKPEDLIDSAGMEAKYDGERKVFYLQKEVELNPRQTSTFEVRVKNVWHVPDEDIQKVREEIEQSVNSLKGTKYAQTGQMLYEKVVEKINRIEEEQAKAVGIKQKIEFYRAHVKQLADIQGDVFSLGAMRRMDEETKEGVREVKFFITAENPSDQPLKMMVRSYLPKEIKSDDITDRLDFNLVFSQNKNRFALEKEDNFTAKEIKKYQITLRDIWYIPQGDLDFLRKQAEKLVVLFKETPYEKYADQQCAFIFDSLDKIKQLQDEVASSTVLEDRMRASVLNNQRLELIRKKMRELQDLLPEVALKKDNLKPIEQIKHLIKKIVDTRDLILVAFGIQPNKPITWWLIFGIMGFMALLTGVFYMTWLKKLQENKWVSKAGKQGKK